MRREHLLQIRLNGERKSLTVPPNAVLAETLASALGTRIRAEACDDGRCGECLVSVDGALVHACLLLSLQADGTAVLTGDGSPVPGVAARVRGELAQDAERCGRCDGRLVLLACDAVARGRQGEALRETICESACACGAAARIVSVVEEVAAARAEAARALGRVGSRKPRRRSPRVPAPDGAAEPPSPATSSAETPDEP